MNFSDLRAILQYVPQFRGHTFVLALDGAVIDSPDFSNILLDVAVLRSLNIRVVLVHGAAAQIAALGEKRSVPLSNVDGTGVTVNCLHPGAVATRMGRNNGWLGVVASLLTTPFFKSPERGARTSVYLASSKEVEGVTGRYFDKVRQLSTSAITMPITPKTSPAICIATRLLPERGSSVSISIIKSTTRSSRITIKTASTSASRVISSSASASTI